MKRYNPKDIEPKWQKKWAEEKYSQAVDFDKRPKYVMLTEFPYPSGDGLHLGHVREYTYGDMISRHKRMKGFNVLYPMGWDAFGLPTENYAIKMKLPPKQITEQNVATFRQQMEAMGHSFDWSRVVDTTDPKYYKWTQWLFLQFYKHGLAYQDDIAINWCPHCKTGLANEEVINGRHERCDTIVEKKQLKQWLLKITAYADRLIDGLKDVDYPSRIADQQVNWIGRSTGATIEFKVENCTEKISTFTTAHDTIFGATFVVIAPEHPLVSKITTDEHKASVGNYIKVAQSKSEIERQDAGREKTGVATGAHAVHPITGDKIPIWIADYVLVNYGTGAIMAVPGQDERDFEFANKYSLPIVYTTSKNEFVNYQKLIKSSPKSYTLANSGEFDGLDYEVGREKILRKLVELGVGEEKTLYKLRDWIFSRQHYWGEPIPIIHCPEHGAVAVPDDQLPVVLPEVKQYEPTDTGESPLAEVEDWVNTTCPTCGGPAKRETDTMPNWAGSSWYYLRYYDANNDNAFADKEKLKYWGEVDLYLGGMEHTTLHLLYSRFWHQFFYDQDLVPTPEPYAARRGQGIILAADGSKMSKSKGNVINPNEVINSGYGADALRLAIAFLAPYDQTTPWSPEGVAGTHRFLNRVWTLVQEFSEEHESKNITNTKQLTYLTHKVIKRISEDLESLSFNTAVAALMEYVNELYKLKTEDKFEDKDAWKETFATLLQLLAPFAPHIAEELWLQLGQTSSIHAAEWPTWDKNQIIDETITIVVQVNGKVRAQLSLPTGSDKELVIQAAKSNEHVQTYLKSEVVKEIFVPNRLVNFVVR